MAKAAAVVPVVPVVVLVVLAGVGAGAGLHHSWCTLLAGTPARTVGNPSHPGLVALALRRSTNCGWPPPPAPASLSLVLQALLLLLVVLVLLQLQSSLLNQWRIAWLLFRQALRSLSPARHPSCRSGKPQ